MYIQRVGPPLERFKVSRDTIMVLATGTPWIEHSMKGLVNDDRRPADSSLGSSTMFARRKSCTLRTAVLADT
jgi:hypothetical protein